MSHTTRRDLVRDAALRLPVLSLFAALAAAGQQASPPPPVKSQNGLQTDLAHCKAFPFADLPLRYSDAGAPTHDILRGTLPTGELVELHETTIAAGKMPHPAHQHPHCEFILVREGTIEFSYAGAIQLLAPGSVGFTAPDEMHGFRNPGPGPATYFIFSVGKH